MRKYSEDGKRTLCIYCNEVYPTGYLPIHYSSYYHLEQLCQKKYGMSAEKFTNLVCEEEFTNLVCEEE